MLKFFRLIALLEGVSYILLLFIATPIKYLADYDTFVKMLGMPHGLLFIAYIVLAVILQFKYKWNVKTFVIILVASLLPFGTFYIDKKYLSKLQ